MFGKESFDENRTILEVDQFQFCHHSNHVLESCQATMIEK